MQIFTIKPQKTNLGFKILSNCKLEKAGYNANQNCLETKVYFYQCGFYFKGLTSYYTGFLKVLDANERMADQLFPSTMFCCIQTFTPILPL